MVAAPACPNCGAEGDYLKGPQVYVCLTCKVDWWHSPDAGEWAATDYDRRGWTMAAGGEWAAE